MQGISPIAAEHQIADASDLQHRHPLLWSQVGDLQLRVWQARKIAHATHHLSYAACRWVDAAVADYTTSLPFGRLMALVEAKIIEVDPEAAEERRKAAAAARFVHAGASNEHGLKTLVAQAAAGDIIYFVAATDRVAAALEFFGDTEPVDVRAGPRRSGSWPTPPAR